MVLYIMKNNEDVVYLGYNTIKAKATSTGPNGTYPTIEGFTKDKKKAVSIGEFFIGKQKLPLDTKAILKEDVHVIEVPYLVNYILTAEDKKTKRNTPEVIRTYLLALDSTNGEFNKVFPYKGFFNPPRVTNPLIIGDNVFYTPTAFNGLKDGKYFIVTNPPAEMGRNSNTALYSIVHVEEPLPNIYELSEIYNKQCDDYDNPICIYLKNINTVVASMYTRDMGIKDLKVIDIDFHREKIPAIQLSNFPLVEMLYPPGLAFRALERLEALEVIFSKYRTNTLNKRFTAVDITDKIWLDNNIRSDYNPGKKLKVITEHNMPIPFIPGIDIPSYESLKKLAKKNPKCILLIEDEGASSRYMFIIESDLGSGIYHSHFSNRVFKKALRVKK